MKKILKLLLMFTFIFSILSCQKEDTNKIDSGKKVVTVTTTFLEDIVYHLAGDSVEIKLIIPAGEDPHLYLPKPEDLGKISEADLLLYHGLHFEGKMIAALEPSGVEVAKNFSHEDLGKMKQYGEEIVDPHFWFNIKLYKAATEVVSIELQNLLPKEINKIKENTKKYLVELSKLDEENKIKIEAIPESQRILVTPHDAFNYFAKSYGLQVVAPQGVSTDSEISNKDITKTVDYIVKNKIKAIFAESTTDPARMDKLKESCNSRGWDVKVVKGEGNELFSDSLAQKGKEGDTYIDMYKHNVNLITENLK